MSLSEIRLSNCQIKSIEKARTIAGALHVLEVESGIRVCGIKLVDCFICPDLYEHIETLDQTPMERVLREVLLRLRK